MAARHRGTRIETAGLVAAAFDHRTSRAGDPLLHTHVVVANLTLTVADTWRTLDGRPLYDHAISGGYLYQAHLRHLLTERLGVDWAPVVEGMADIAGVPQAVIDEFSQRRDEIEETLAESGHTSARARQKATLATRRPKERTVDPDTLAHTWRERARAIGFDDDAVEACFGRVRTTQRGAPDADRLFAHLAGPHGLTERRSTFTRRDVVRAIAADVGTETPAIEIERLADRFLASERVVVLAGPTSGRNAQVVIGLDGRRVRTGGTAVFSTPELIELETSLLARATAKGGRTIEERVVDEVVARRPDLSSEQAAMVRAVCSTERAIRVVVGRPGSGKTYATAACVEAYAASGIPVAGCAVSAVAAAELNRRWGSPPTRVDPPKRSPACWSTSTNEATSSHPARSSSSTRPPWSALATLPASPPTSNAPAGRSRSSVTPISTAQSTRGECSRRSPLAPMALLPGSSRTAASVIPASVPPSLCTGRAVSTTPSPTTTSPAGSPASPPRRPRSTPSSATGGMTAAQGHVRRCLPAPTPHAAPSTTAPGSCSRNTASSEGSRSSCMAVSSWSVTRSSPVATIARFAPVWEASR